MSTIDTYFPTETAAATPARRTRKPKQTIVQEVSNMDSNSAAAAPVPTPAKRTRKPKQTVVQEVPDVDANSAAAPVPTPVPTPAKRTRKPKQVVDIPQRTSTEERTLDYLATKNAHPRDANIIFYEEDHKYKVNGEFGYTSVTTLIDHSGWFNEFDSEKVITCIINGRNMNDPNYKYYGMTADQIRELWKENGKIASSQGTQTHLNIEKYYNGMQVEDDSVEFGYFLNFVKDHPHLEPYRTEWSVYHDEARISGQIDILFFNKITGEYEIGDWKRTKEMIFYSTNTFKEDKGIPSCLSDLDNINYVHYSLQLSIYKWILAEKYGINATKLFLVVLHPNQTNYVRHDVKDVEEYQERIRQLMQPRIEANLLR